MLIEVGESLALFFWYGFSNPIIYKIDTIIDLERYHNKMASQKSYNHDISFYLFQ